MASFAKLHKLVLSKTINLLKQKYKKGMDQGQILQEPNKIKFGSIFVVSHLSFK